MKPCRIPKRFRLLRREMHKRRWELFRKSIDALSKWSFYLPDGEPYEVNATWNHGSVYISVDNPNAVEIKTVIYED